MTPQRIRVETAGIRDEASFHRVFSEVMGFPTTYGKNMSSWIDCMSFLDDGSSGMTTCSVMPGELFYLEVADTRDFQRRVPQVFKGFMEAAATVNARRIEGDEPPVLALILV